MAKKKGKLASGGARQTPSTALIGYDPQSPVTQQQLSWITKETKYKEIQAAISTINNELALIMQAVSDIRYTIG